MNMIYLAILFPIIGFMLLFFLKDFLSYLFSILISLFCTFLSMVTVLLLGYRFIYGHDYIIKQTFWTLWNIKNFNVDIGFLIDGLTFVFLAMITIVAFLVVVFSVWYMKSKLNKIVFFELVHLFVFSMLILVLSNNFIFMYLGWESISICSYLLINFYYFKKYVTVSAFKSFIFTKIGDLFLITAILLIYIHYGSLDFYEISFLSKVHLIGMTPLLFYINLFLLIGAIGKSAQIPLQIWLPEAMVGPTPVSALIHAATMVTAGIYLITRNYSLFMLTPSILYIIGVIGSLTLIFSSIVALIEVDIKRILAYSTMSQIGYMFIALSVGAWNAAIVHLVVHAIFKALLFLSAGVLISACREEQNIFCMGNQLYRIFPFLYFCFLIGGFSLSGFPIFTLSFYSKDRILFYIYHYHNMFFLIVAMLSICLTTCYIFRLIFIVFHTKSQYQAKNLSINFFQCFPLVIFSFFSTYLGKFIIPNLSNMFPKIILSTDNQLYLEIFSGFLVMLSIIFTYYFYVYNKYLMSRILFLKLLYNFLLFIKNKDFGFFYIYNLFFYNFYLKIACYLSYKPFSIFNEYLLCILNKTSFFLSCAKNYTFSVFVIIMSCYFIFLVFFITVYTN